MAYNEQFIAIGKEADLVSALASGNIKDTSIVFLEETGKEAIRAQGKSYQAVPSNGRDGQVLVASNGKGVWADFDIADTLSYGVEWKPDVADPVLTRVGNMNYHRSLPIQSGMRGCIYNPKEKKVVYWLDEDNWNYKKGGNPDKGEVEDLARLDGYDGEVFVYVPEFYIRSWDEAGRRAVRISSVKIDETWEHQPALFMGAYRDTVLDTVPEDMGYLSTLEANTAISVANNNVYCRGGDNTSENDAFEDIFRRHLGKCRTTIQRSTFRTYTRKANKEIMSYRQYKNILYWLWVIEYANFNSQDAFSSELTAEGFHQGGMGFGLTTMYNWDEYNSSCPISPNGYTNEFGNGTGVKDFVIPEFTYDAGNTIAAQTLEATRWRGIENPFGDILHNVDGVIIGPNKDDYLDGTNYVYTTDDPTKYGDTLDDIDNMVLSRIEIYEDGYTKEWDLGTTAEIIPRLMGGYVTQYKCDYHYAEFNSTTIRTLMLGGGANYGAYAGLGHFDSTFNVDSYSPSVGFRSVSVV